MKTLVTFCTVVLPCSLFMNCCWSQQVPAELMEQARLQFNAVFEQVYGKAPEPSVTDRAMQTYQQEMANLTKSLGTQAGVEARFRDRIDEAKKQYNGIEYLKIARGLNADAFDDSIIELRDVKKFVRSDAPFNQLQGPDFQNVGRADKFAEKLQDGSEIVFPQGSFEIDKDVLYTIYQLNTKRGKASFPNRVAFVGAGKNKTTIKMGGISLDHHGDVDRLSFRDMTIDCGNDGLFDKRSGSLTLELSNVKIVRFDAGHGGCHLFSIQDGLVVYARNTNFVGGLGCHPGRGAVFCHTCSPLIGHFKGCTFSGIEDDLFRDLSGRNTKIWMEKCLFDRSFEIDRIQGEGVEFLDCKFDVEFLPPGKWVDPEI